jgi:hypothetical protein
MTYKFPQFNVEIIYPVIIMTMVHDNVIDHTCDVDLELTSDGAKFGITLVGFKYVSDWSDDEVRIWAFIELQKYEV